MDEDGIRVEARDSGGCRLGTSLGLRGRPYVAAIRADMRGAVHRLHRGVRQEWNFVIDINFRRRCSKSRVDIAYFSRNWARAFGGISKQFADAGTRELC